MEYAELKQLAIDLEAFETPVWSVQRVLEREILTQQVVDPCVGRGVLADNARHEGYSVFSIDIHDWGFPGTHIQNFLTMKPCDFEDIKDFTILMNPPFSLATQFVEKSLELGARKIVMFQRWSFSESSRRRSFFEKHPMARKYLLCDRADCWRFDLPVNDRGKRYDPEKDNKELSSTPTSHGWYVWERGQESSAPPTFSLYK
jgi:hypothetical protein